MRTIMIALLVAGGIGLVSTSTSSGAPANGAAIAKAAATASTVQEVRRYCYRHWRYNSRTRFLHWGRC